MNAKQGDDERLLTELELLSSAGARMAGSFDLRHILGETHRVAVSLLGSPPVDVLYLGRDSIHSRRLWYPPEPGEGNLSAPERSRLERSLAFPPGAEDQAEAVLRTELETGGRAGLPLRYQEELLGVLFYGAPEQESAGTGKLLALLAQHASTALRNIHLAQERIQFERLSAIGRMIGTIVHDFRGPLTALRGYAGMMARLDLSDSDRRSYGGFMVEECDRLAHMVEELLEFTRGGRPELSLEWIDVAEYLSAFADRLRRYYEDRGIEVELSSSYSGEIRGDRARLERALWNIAANACQAMPGGGLLTLRSQERAGEVLIELQDRGCGIPEEIRHRIFEPFFSHGKSEGIGLGMVTAQKIVEEHGGAIEVESAPAQGTLVRLLLPMYGSLETPEETEAPASVQGSSGVS